MTGGTLALRIAALAVFTLLGLMTGYPLGHWRGKKHGKEEARWQEIDERWKGLAGAAARPVPVRPPVPQAPRPERGRHRHPGGPPQHAALPAAGYLPAPDAGPWNGTITLPAPVQAPPWDLLPPEPEPVLEPTAVLPPPAPDARTDSQWTRQMARDMDAWIAEHITATDRVLKEITR